MEDFMDDMDFQEGFEDGSFDDWNDEEYSNDDYSDNIDDGNPYQKDVEQDTENWIDREQAMIMGYGFGLEEGLAEKQRRRRLWEEKQERRKRNNENGR